MKIYQISTRVFAVLCFCLILWQSSTAQVPARINSLLTQIQQTRNNQQKTGFLLELASLEIQQEMHNQALMHATQAFTLAHSNNQKMTEGKSLLLKGRAYRHKLQYTNALEQYLQALTTFNDLKHIAGLVKANQLLGDLYRTWGIWDKAINYYKMAYQLIKNPENEEKIKISENIARIYALQNKNAEGIEWLKRTLAGYRSIKNDEKIISSLHVLSDLSQKTHQEEEALAYNLEIIKLQENSTSQQGLIESYNNVGFLYKRQKQYAKALKNYRKALFISHKQIVANNPETIKQRVGILTNIAVVQIHLKTPQEAQDSYTKALKLAQTHHDALLTANVYNHLAAYSYIHNKNYKALEQVQQAVDLASPLENHSILKHKAQTSLTTSYKLLSGIHQKFENYQLSKKYYEQYSQIKLSQKQAELQRKQRLLQNQINIEQKENELKLLIKEKERQALALKQAQSEAQKKESDLKLRTQELELLKKSQQLQQEQFKSQQLEQERMQQLLAFTKQQALASQQKQQIALLEKNKAFQALALKQKETEQIEKQQKIALLEKDRKMKAASLEEAKTIRKYGLWVISLGTLAFIAVVVGLVVAFRSKKKVVAQNRLINIKQEEILTQNEELQQQQEELAAQRDFAAQKSKELNHHNQQIKKSIVYASNIQNALLPSHTKLADHFREHFVIFLPKDIVSGDFYWFTQIDNHKFLAVVDCTGHGVPGAFMSMIGNSVLNETVNEKGIDDPARILARLHRKVREGLNQQVGQNSDGMDVCLCRLTPTEDGRTEVVFAGAKRNIHYVHNNTLHKLKGDRVAIGGYQHEEKRAFTNQTVMLLPNDTLYLMSDGFVDTANSKRRSFGEKRFEAVINTHIENKLGTQKQELIRAMNEFKKHVEQRDDILVVGVRV